MNLYETIKNTIYVDCFVSKSKSEEEQRNHRGIGLIATAAFIVMSFLNLKQRSYVMLGTTGMSAILLMLGYMVSRLKKNTSFLKMILYIIFVVIFTSYTIMGGNDGFAVLWLITATYAVMIAIDFKVGFAISFYYLIMLLLVFIGPFSFLLQFDYNETFRLRFPFLYAINFSFATYIAIRIRVYQYELLLKQQELERLSTVDLSTGLKNRNYFIQYERTFSCDNLKSLMAVFIDVNGLHEINNREGHDAGDRMLCKIADLCRNFFPDHAVYRIGGDEFLILCKNVIEDDVLNTVDHLNDSVKQAGYSISYGVEIQKSDFDLNELVKKADGKMIAFKRAYYMYTDRDTR